MPDWLILTIKIVSGPLVGALIGFFTNWLAVKMLFRPYGEKRIGKFRVPFTPGIIPKRKAALGRALGNAVGTQLLTPGDINALFCSETVKENIGRKVAEAVCRAGGETMRGLVDSFAEGSADKLKEKASAFVTEKAVGAVKKVDLPALLSEHAGDALSGIGGMGNLLGVFGGAKLMSKLATGVGEKLEKYIDENGYDTLLPIVTEEIDKLLALKVSDAENALGLTEDKIAEFAANVYEKYIVDKIAGFVADFDIAGIVEKKVDDMDMKELERLFMSVMKRELGAIVNLGALLGALVGIITSLITIFL